MKKTPDTTLAVLKDIRGEIRSTNTRIDALRDDLGGLRGDVASTNDRLDALREELSRRIVESEVRTSTALTDLAGTVGELTAHLKGQHDLEPRVERCEQDIAEIKARLPHAS
jgi:predicted  nucleic acid-binding Zn-ribbon protein